MDKDNKSLVEVKSQAPAFLDPATQIDLASKAAKGLMTLIDNSQYKPIMVNNQKYLRFEHWQTIARFFNASVGTDQTVEIVRDGKLVGFSAKAVVYDNFSGKIIGSAEADCLMAEVNWKNKPEFQVKSMAQTRASAKALRNIYGWVAVLAGYEATPAEEMSVVGTAPSKPVSMVKNDMEVKMVCSNCDKLINNGVNDFSRRRYGKPLCMECQPRFEPLKK